MKDRLVCLPPPPFYPRAITHPDGNWSVEPIVSPLSVPDGQRVADRAAPAAALPHPNSAVHNILLEHPRTRARATTRFTAYFWRLAQLRLYAVLDEHPVKSGNNRLSLVE